jgi:hypothetical protein
MRVKVSEGDMESRKDMPDVRREFKAILEAIVVAVSWRRRVARIRSRPIKFPRGFSLTAATLQYNSYGTQKVLLGDASPCPLRLNLARICQVPMCVAKGGFDRILK